MKYNPSVSEALAQRLHDLSIDDGLCRILEYDDKWNDEKKSGWVYGWTFYCAKFGVL